ncbi:MAG: class I SAM-dependent methyltransferase [bacterium]
MKEKREIPQSQVERYRDEAEFFDREAAEFATGRKSLRFSNQLTYEQYFDHAHAYRVAREFLGPVNGKKILDYACGSGWVSIYFARSGAECYGFDISPRSIEVATQMAADNGLGEQCEFKVSTAEAIDYPDNSFDLLFGNAALHHTDLELSPAEIARVLKPGGRACFIDDLRYHPVMWVYRKVTRDKHTRFETPMRLRDIEKFKPYFSSVKFEAHDFFNIFPKKRGLARIAEPLDRVLLKVLPFSKYFCRHLLIKLIR